MKHVIRILVSITLFGFLLSACESSKIFVKRKYYVSNYQMEFYADNTYLFMDQGHSGYVEEVKRGTWKQVGRDLILSSRMDNAEDLFVKMRKANWTGDDIQVVVNLLPTVIYFDYLPKPTDLVKAELVTTEKVYPLDAEINVIRLPKQLGSLFVRAYPIDTKKMPCKILRDTLKSEPISLMGMAGQTILLDVDINPINFAWSTRVFDTLKIINDRKIKWNKIVLSR